MGAKRGLGSARLSSRTARSANGFVGSQSCCSAFNSAHAKPMNHPARLWCMPQEDQKICRMCLLLLTKWLHAMWHQHANNTRGYCHCVGAAVRLVHALQGLSSRIIATESYWKASRAVAHGSPAINAGSGTGSVPSAGDVRYTTALRGSPACCQAARAAASQVSPSHQ